MSLQEYATLASRHEAFINDKTKWISDKYFTQQRLAGTNPMSLQRVTVHERGKAAGKCLVQGGGAGMVIKKVLYGEALSRGSIPYPFYMPFLTQKVLLSYTFY